MELILTGTGTIHETDSGYKNHQARFPLCSIEEYIQKNMQNMRIMHMGELCQEGTVSTELDENMVPVSVMN